MTEYEPTGLDDQSRAELGDSPAAQHEGAIDTAVTEVARSHGGRPVDEIQSVLRQAVESATGDRTALSDRSIERVAQRIADSSPST